MAHKGRPEIPSATLVADKLGETLQARRRWTHQDLRKVLAEALVQLGPANRADDSEYLRCKFVTLLQEQNLESLDLAWQGLRLWKSATAVCAPAERKPFEFDLRSPEVLILKPFSGKKRKPALGPLAAERTCKQLSTPVGPGPPFLDRTFTRQQAWQYVEKCRKTVTRWPRMPDRRRAGDLSLAEIVGLPKSGSS